MCLRDVCEHRGREPVALVGDRAGGTPALRPLVLTGLGQFLDLGELRPGVDGTDVGVLVHRVTQAQGLEPALEGVQGLLGDRLLQQQATTCAAHVTLVEVDAVDDALDGLVDGSVVEDDVRCLTTEFEGELLARPRHRALDRLAHLGGSGEGDLVHIGVLHEHPSGFTGAGDDVDHAGW